MTDTWLGEVQTPLVVVDLARAERNIRRAQDYCDAHGYDFRPHVKTHKLPELARMQIAAGAVGITCQTLTEAEIMADGGIDDILVTYPVLGTAKVERLAALTERATLAVAADSTEAVEACGAAGQRSGKPIGFLVECETGMDRLGVRSPGDAVALAQRVDATAGVRFAGLMTYPTGPDSGAILRACRDALTVAGIDTAVVSGGGTPTLYKTHELAGDVITEIRAGEYVFGDRTHLARGVVSADEIAAVVLTTVVGRPTESRAILDAGSKALSSDPAGQPSLRGFGLIAEHPDAVIYELSEEHAHVDISRCERRPEIGDRVRVIPNHVCPCINLAELVALRSAEGIRLAPVQARGVAGPHFRERKELV